MQAFHDTIIVGLPVLVWVYRKGTVEVAVDDDHVAGFPVRHKWRISLLSASGVGIFQTTLMCLS